MSLRKLKEKVVFAYYSHVYPAFLRKRNLLVKCPFCGWKSNKFVDKNVGGGRVYKNSSCPMCQSQPRHRSFYFYLKEILPKNEPIKVLHFAPERFLSSIFKSYKNIEYLSVDIDRNKAMKQEDITNLSFADNSFDIILCSHVLEHVMDDKKAMKELFRVLKKGGIALIDVPIDYKREKTFEDYTVTSPQERTRLFWQHDHVRLYGKDFPDKLKKVGFKDIYDKFKHIESEKKKRFGLKRKPIYSFTK